MANKGDPRGEGGIYFSEWMAVFRQAGFPDSRIEGDRSHRTFLVSAFEWKFPVNGPWRKLQMRNQL